MLSLFSPPTLGSRALSEDGRSTDDASSLSNAPTQEDVGNDNLPALTEEEEGGATSPLNRSVDLFNSGRSASASVAHNTDAAPAPPVALQPGVAFEGHLEKQADWLSSWRLRYFQVLEKGTLVYWLSADAATPRGLIELRDAAAIAVQTSDTSSGHVFVVKGPRQRTATLRASTAEERAAWLNAINTVASRLTPLVSAAADAAADTRASVSAEAAELSEVRRAILLRNSAQFLRNSPTADPIPLSDGEDGQGRARGGAPPHRPLARGGRRRREGGPRARADVGGDAPRENLRDCAAAGAFGSRPTSDPSPHPTPLTPPSPLLQERLRAVEVTASELSDFSSQLETLLGAVDSEDTILAQKLHKERGMASRVEKEVAEAEARLDGQRAHRSALEARAEKLRVDAAAAAARNQAELHKCDRLPPSLAKPTAVTRPQVSHRPHPPIICTGTSATASRSRSSVSSRSATAPS
jgi:hypothetical protein